MHGFRAFSNDIRVMCLLVHWSSCLLRIEQWAHAACIIPDALDLGDD